LPENFEADTNISISEKESLFLINYKNALNIDDVNINILEDP